MKHALRNLALATLFVLGASAAIAQDRAVTGHALVWDPNSKQGYVLLNADRDGQPEVKVKVASIAELAAWGTYLSENEVRIRTYEQRRVLWATKKR